MGFATILALDLGKFKTVACVMDTSTRRHAFETIDTSPATVRDLVARHMMPADPSATLVVFETCDTAGWVHDVCTSLGTSVTVVNANDERWRWRRVKRKTDRDDALKLARLALLDQLGAVHMPAPARAAASPAHAPPPLGRLASHAEPQRRPRDLQPAGSCPRARRQAVDDRRRRAAARARPTVEWG
jgi:hypothetical protein